MHKKLLTLLILSASPFFVRQALAFNPIIINEVMYDLTGSDDNHEWVEIKNISVGDIDLTGWKFSDGSNHNLNLPPKNGGQGSLVIPSGGYAILADRADVFLSDYPGFSGIVIDTVMSLNNAAENLKIIDADGQTVEQISYDNSLGANGDGYSLERTGDYIAQFCPARDLGGSVGLENNPNCYSKPSPTESITTTPSLSPTPLSNLAANLTEKETSVEMPKALIIELIINEFIPNPSGSDEENEWVEIYNAGQEDVNLAGWKLQDLSGKAYNLETEIIKAKGHLVLTRNQTKISINNDAETLILLSPDSIEAFKISFTGGSQEGYSFSRFGLNDWRWTNILTPGNFNQSSGGISQNGEQDLNSVSPQPSALSNLVGAAEQKTDSFSMNKIVLLAAIVGLSFGAIAIIILKKYIS